MSLKVGLLPSGDGPDNPVSERMMTNDGTNDGTISDIHGTYFMCKGQYK